MSDDHRSSAAEYVASARTLYRNQDFFGALEAADKAIEVEPDNAIGHFARGQLLAKLARDDEALASYKLALTITPKDADLHVAYGDSLDALARVDEACVEYRHATELAPDAPAGYDRLALCLCRLGRHQEAVDVYEKLWRMFPDNEWYRNQFAERCILLGRFDEGWDNCYDRLSRYLDGPYEWAQDIWDGVPRPGQTVIVRCMAGRGDTIHIARLMPLFHDLGLRVAVECQQGLASLLAGAPGIDEVYELDEDDGPADFPGYSDIHVMTVLPYFRVDLGNPPGQCPYLKVDEGRLRKWAQRINELSAPHPHVLKVGICWAGSATHANDGNRSMRLDDFAPLAAYPDVLFFSLQKGYEFEYGLPDPPPGITLIDIGSEIKDYADTAAVMENLDLVISVDTSVVHVAGAIGRPVWTLLPIDPDWRWSVQREDCPWYPSMRLFRQTAYRRWDTVMPRVAEELRKLVEARRTKTNEANA